MKILVLLSLLLCLTCFALGQDYQEVDEKPISRLRSPRGPVVGNRANKQQIVKTSTTSTTTTEQAPEEYDANYDEEEQPATTTTEAPRKGIRGGVVRPFRSNEDLIEALKRRRAQVSSGYTHVPSSTTTTTFAPQDKSQRRSKTLDTSRKFNRNHTQDKTTSTEPPQEEQTQRSKYTPGRGRRF